MWGGKMTQQAYLNLKNGFHPRKRAESTSFNSDGLKGFNVLLARGAKLGRRHGMDIHVGTGIARALSRRARFFIEATSRYVFGFGRCGRARIRNMGPMRWGDSGCVVWEGILRPGKGSLNCVARGCALGESACLGWLTLMRPP